MSERAPHIPFGVQIESGPQDWQIIQRSAAGTATIDLAGTWVEPAAFKRGRGHSDWEVRRQVQRQLAGSMKNIFSCRPST